MFSYEDLKYEIERIGRNVHLSEEYSKIINFISQEDQLNRIINRLKTNYSNGSDELALFF